MKYLKNNLAVLFAIPLLYLMLTSWPPQRAIAQFPSQGLFAGTAGGTANAVTLTVPNMSSIPAGVPITFIPSSNNTAATTVNVNGLGNLVVRRVTSVGTVGFSGSEFQSGILTAIEYDGSAGFQILYPSNPAPIGSTVDLRGSALPPGYLVEDGSCVSQTTYAALFTVISTNYGSCSAGLFAVPDSRGSLNAALDNQGANGAASRLTSGGSGCGATSVAFRCGAQNNTLITANLPPYTPSGTVSPRTGVNAPPSVVDNGQTGSAASSGASFSVFTTGSFSVLQTPFVGAAQGGTSTPITNVPPVLGATRAIKF